MNRRTARVNDLLREELSQMVSRQPKDPRLAALLTISEVAVSGDLAVARVYISVLGTPEEQQSVMEGLASAAGFLRRELGSRLKLRRVPELRFIQDTSIEEGSRLLDLINQVNYVSHGEVEQGA